MATVWRGFLSFGLVSIPIKLHKAARAEKVNFRMLRRTPAPEPEEAPVPTPSRRGSAPVPFAAPEPQVQRVHQALVTESEPDEPIPSQEVVRGYEYAKDQYVVVDKEELQAIQPETSKEMQILQFVKLQEIDPLFFENSYYVAPDKSGEKPYALLYKALQESGSVGLAEVAMYRREHTVVLRAGEHGIVAHTMFYLDEIRKQEEFHADTSVVNERELKLALALVDGLTAPFQPEQFKDKYRERLQALIDQKLAGKQVVAEQPAAAKKAEVIDIVSALQQSLDRMKKPPAKEEAAPAAKKRKAR